MYKANVTYTRNHLSEILARVREGETILIMDRQQPVARLVPIEAGSVEGVHCQGDLIRRGLLRPARHRLDPKSLAALPWPKGRDGGDIVDSLLADREEGP